ncbi:helix-turn-helix domain-containing protein [Patulibacter minatonensis]|uniref:helix-turn-helix domain-containing protein n=1 Tax=Patulibacter minatonensis TaxID=298163 RepID=UPI00055FC89A|nr:helix-turn-helix domain-containing protein [Patulibacter minatonensis]
MNLLDQLAAEIEQNPAGAERVAGLLVAAIDPDRRFTAAEMAERWNANPRTVERWCRDGRIPTATKVGHRWLIPADAVVEPKAKKDHGPARAYDRKAGPHAAASARVLDAMKPQRKGRAA